MPKNQDQQIALPGASGIFSHANPESIALRVVVITTNPNKFEEFRSQLGDGYGMDVQQMVVGFDVDLDDEAVLADLCKQSMAEQRFSPHFILREATSLVSQKGDLELTHLPLDELTQHHLESVVHTASLKIFKPQWSVRPQESGKEEKELSGFSLRCYERRSEGYIKSKGVASACKHGFGWDALFINAATNLSNDEYYERYGKKSARQHVISAFIETYLRYKSLVTLKHHQLPLHRPIDFAGDYFHLTDFIRKDKHLSNAHVGDWGIDKLRAGVINEGMFVKAAWSRPVKNYFSPPFSGLPLTAKKDEAEETIFMQHDILHHLVCDLICDASATKANFHIYSAWRMISEACTLVLADMLYADGLIKSGVERSCVDKRIYPLFESIKTAQNIPSPKEMNAADKSAFIRKLLFANVCYALLGDDREWRVLLTSADGLLHEEHLKCLEAYKNHFGKFFIGDNAWTRANFDNMQKQGKPLSEWIKQVGPEQFRKAQIPLLSDVAKTVDTQAINTQEYTQVVRAVFDVVFDTKIAPHLTQKKVAFANNALLQSRAFRRFLIGQSSLFARYPTLLNLEHIPKKIFSRLQDDSPFSNQEQEALREMMEHYIVGLECQHLMSREEALNAIDCLPVFPPVYISYPQMQKKYTTIANCVVHCIDAYQGVVELPAQGSNSQSLFYPNIPAAVVDINNCLDKIDATLMVRGQQTHSMYGDYQNQLYQYKEVLSLLAKDPCSQQAHKAGLAINPALFSRLIVSIEATPAASYAQAIAKVRETLASRINYFNGLTCALATDRLSKPVDVAWFHQTHSQLINHYLAQHPANKMLLMHEDDRLKKHCAFRKFKLKIVQQVELATRSLCNRADQFFTPNEDIYYQAGNYFRYHLSEPLNVFAKDIHINNAAAYLESIDALQQHFLVGLNNLMPDNKSASIALSEQAVELVKLFTKNKLNPLFQHLKDDLRPKPDAAIALQEVNVGF